MRLASHQPRGRSQGLTRPGPAAASSGSPGKRAGLGQLALGLMAPRMSTTKTSVSVPLIPAWELPVLP